MSLRHWPEGDRPREKLLEHGPGALSDAELLAIFLRTGTREHTALDLARQLLHGYGGLRPLLAAPVVTVCERPGMGPAKYAQLQAALEIGQRHLRECLARGAALASPADTGRYLTSRLRDLEHEVFACLFLDTRHRVIRYEELFRGTIDSATVHPREVLKRALHHNAAAVILAHNHPSGVSEPSQADCRLTLRLREALGLIDIRLLDHIVVGDGEICSLAQRGLL